MTNPGISNFNAIDGAGGGNRTPDPLITSEIANFRENLLRSYPLGFPRPGWSRKVAKSRQHGQGYRARWITP